jgi:hypothetical protein
MFSDYYVASKTFLKILSETSQDSDIFNRLSLELYLLVIQS